MNVDAYSDFSEISTSKLRTAFKCAYRNIPKEQRALSLNQGYQKLANCAQFSSFEAMNAQDSVLITVNEFSRALASCGYTKPSGLYVSKLLECDVLCMSLSGNLCIAITDNVVIDTPFLMSPSPYIPNAKFYTLSVDASDGAWLTFDEWQDFIEKLRNTIDFELDDIESQISDIWDSVSPDCCGELFLSEVPNYEEMETYSEGKFRQTVLDYSGHTPISLIYDYFTALSGRM